MSYLSETWDVFDDGSVALDPLDLGHGRSSGLADDLGSGRVGEVHLVGRFLDEDGAVRVALGHGWIGFQRKRKKEISSINVKAFYSLVS